MDPAWRSLIEALHAAPHQCVLAVAGGGTEAAAQMLNVPGGSRTVLEIVVPYHERALSNFLGRRPEQFCSPATSRALAVRAYERACWLAPEGEVVGLGCTASLATDRPKRGDHRVHLAVHTAAGGVNCSLTLTKGARDREGEEAVVDALLLNALAEAFAITSRLVLPLLPAEEIQSERSPPDLLARLLRGEVAAVGVDVDGRMALDLPRPAVILPGAFNPLHQGHAEMAATAARRLGSKAAFELSVVNVDKPPLPLAEVRRRLAQFTWQAPVWVTRAPTFFEKAAMFPGAVFAVGADTAQRILALRYYQESEKERSAALQTIRKQGCRFLVLGRQDFSGKFQELGDLCVPDDCRDLFQGVPRCEFHNSISSTELRRQAQPGAGAVNPPASE
jgi:hypothetical protein